MARRGHNVRQRSKALAWTVLALLITGDAGVEALRAQALRSQSRYLSGRRAAEHEEAEDQNSSVVRHNRALSFTVGDSSASSISTPVAAETVAASLPRFSAADLEQYFTRSEAAAWVADLGNRMHEKRMAEGVEVSTGADAQLEPILTITGITLGLLGGMVASVTAMRQARASLLRKSYEEELNEVVLENDKVIKKQLNIYENTLGDIASRIRDTVREVGLSVIQFLPDDKVISMVQGWEANKAAAAGSTTTLDNFDTDIRLADLRGALRELSVANPPPDRAKIARKLRGALFSLLRDDYEREMHVRFAYDEKDAKASLAGQPTVILHSLSASLAGLLVSAYTNDGSADVFEGLMGVTYGQAPSRRLTISDQLLTRSADVRINELMIDKADGVFTRAQRADAIKNNVIRKVGDKHGEQDARKGFKAGETMSEKVVDGFGEGVLNSAGEIIEETAKLGSEFNWGDKKEFFEGIESVAGTGLAYTSVILGGLSLLSNMVTLAYSWRQPAKEALDGSMRMGVASERTESQTRRAVFHACRGLQLLQQPLGAFLSIRLDQVLGIVKNNNPQQPPIVSPLAIKFVNMLGLERITMSDEAKVRVAATLYVRLCALLSPIYDRIAALSREDGICLSKVETAWKLTDSDDQPALNTKKAYIPSIDTCCTAQAADSASCDDLYDLQLTTSAGATFLEGKLNYVRIGDGKHLQAPNAQEKKLAINHRGGTALPAIWDASKRFDAAPVSLNGELNARLSDSSSTLQAKSVDASRVLVGLRCKDLRVLRGFTNNNGYQPQPPNPAAFPDPLNAPYNGNPHPFKVYLESLIHPITDIVLSSRERGTDKDNEIGEENSAELELNGAGYQMLKVRLPEPADFSFVPKANANANALAAHNAKIADFLGRMGTAAKADIDTKTLQTVMATGSAGDRSLLIAAADVNMGRDDKPVVMVHLQRGGITPVRNLMLVPFHILTSSGSNLQKSFLGWLDHYMTNEYTAAVKADPTAANKPFKKTFTDVQTTGINLPYGCKLEDEVARKVDRVARSSLLHYPARFFMAAKYWFTFRWQSYNADRKAKSVGGIRYLTHKFKLTCEDSTQQSQWERIPVSPYEGAESKEARMIKPYLWMQRRFVAPKVRPDPYRPPTCPEGCSPYIVQLMMPMLSRDMGGPSAVFNIDAPLPDRQALAQANPNLKQHEHNNPDAVQLGPQDTVAMLSNLEKDLNAEKDKVAKLTAELKQVQDDLDKAKQAKDAAHAKALEDLSKHLSEMSQAVAEVQNAVTKSSEAVKNTLTGKKLTGDKKSTVASELGSVQTKVSNLANQVGTQHAIVEQQKQAALKQANALPGQKPVI